MSLDQIVADRPAKTAKRYRVVDADAHVDPPYPMWKDYLPAKFQDRAPYIEEGDEHDWVVFEGKKRPLAMLGNKVNKDNKNFKAWGKLSEQREIWLPEVRLRDMDADGMDAAVLFGGGPLGTQDGEFYAASFQAYNRWLADYASADRKRLQPVAYLPMRDVEESMAMLREAAKMGYRVANIPAFPQAMQGSAGGQDPRWAALSGDPNAAVSYRDPQFDPLWATFAELDITITVHLGGRAPRMADKNNFLPDMVMSKLAMAESVAILVYGGVFQRFPTLRYATVESGVGWFAFAAEYMDRTWEKQRFWTESQLTEKPSFYMDQNVYGSFINDRAGILNRNLPGGRNIMWSSDYPHSETTYPNSHAVIARDFVGIPEEDVRDIVCNRAARVYDIG